MLKWKRWLGISLLIMAMLFSFACAEEIAVESASADRIYDDPYAAWC